MLSIALCVLGCGRFGYDRVGADSDGGLVDSDTGDAGTDRDIVFGSGATYYVAEGGSNSNPGTREEPWLTLQHAADTVGVGDTVFTQPGVYQNFRLQAAGAIGNPITFATEGDVVILSAGLDPVGIWVDEADYINILDFQIQSFETGIFVDGNQQTDLVDGATIIGNTIIGANVGIAVQYYRNARVEGNTVSDSKSEGLFVGGSESTDALIRHNLFESGVSGIIASAGPGSSEAVTGLTIDGNKISGMASDGIVLSGVSGTRIENNLVTQTGNRGIRVYLFDLVVNSDIVIVNNTFLVENTAIVFEQSSGENIVFNNVAIGRLGFSIVLDVAGGYQTARNAVNDVSEPFVVDGNAQTLAEMSLLGLAQGSFSVPGPIALYGSDNPATPVPLDGAPIIDQGIPTYFGVSASARDFQGSPRPQGNSYDIGAGER